MVSAVFMNNSGSLDYSRAEIAVAARPHKRGVIPVIFVIPAEAGIQRYLDKSLLYFWFHAIRLRGHKLSGNKPGFPLPRE